MTKSYQIYSHTGLRMDPNGHATSCSSCGWNSSISRSARASCSQSLDTEHSQLSGVQSLRAGHGLGA